VLRPEITVDAQGAVTSFAVRQEAPALPAGAKGEPVLRPHRIAVGLYSLDEGRLVRTHREELDVVGAITTVTIDGLGRADFVLLNDDDLTYAKIRFDDVSTATLRAVGIGAFADSLPRALCWLSTWDMVRNGELAARDYLDLALRSLPTETNIGLVNAVQLNLLTALDFYVAPQARAAASASVAEFARHHLMWAPPGGDFQLAWARLFIRVAVSDDDLELVSGLRDGSATVDGLTIDNDLRWRLLTALARSGRIADDVIGAELAADQTTSGTERAAAAMASRPTAPAKAEAWDQVINQTDLANGLIEAMVGSRRSSGGFAQPTQLDLLEPYVEPYFEAIKGLWESRPAEIASLITTALYPRLLASPALIARTDAYLETAGPIPAVQRILREARDDMQRAVRAQQVDAATPPAAA
jgi:aminopeptidase N